MNRLIVCLLMVCTAGAALADAPHRPLADAPAFRADADAWVGDAMREIGVVPSLIIAVVVEDEAALTAGYGTADREANLPATDETLYYIASATKPFTALAAAILDARGDIDLDGSLAEAAEGVAFADSLHADRVTLENLLTHTSGVSNDAIANRLAFTGEHTPEVLWSLLAKSTPNRDAPIGTFQYVNTGYNILTILLDRRLAKPWQDLLRDEVFTPIGLSRTTAYASLPRAEGWPLAAPYFGLGESGIQRLYLEKTDETMQSAGGMLTTAHDLARWLEFQLNDGRVDGRQVVDAAVVARTHAPIADTDEGRPPFGQRAYGYGWVHGDYREQAVLHHSGGFAGFRSLVSFMPDAKIGVAVVVNEGSIGFSLTDVAAAWAYEWWLGVPAAERTADADLAALVARVPEFEDRLAADRANRADREWLLSRPLSAYAGRFENETWGSIVITEEANRLHVAAGKLYCIAEPYTKPETARVELVPLSGHVILFEPEEGAVERVQLDGVVYERVGG